MLSLLSPSSETLSLGRYYMHFVNHAVGCFDVSARDCLYQVYYQDTDSNFTTVATLERMKELDLIGNKLGQFRNDTGGEHAFVVCGTFAVRKTYMLIIFDGEKFKFKMALKGVRQPLKYNPAIQVWNELSKRTEQIKQGDYCEGEGMETVATTRRDGRVYFTTVRKFMRRTMIKTTLDSVDSNRIGELISKIAIAITAR